MKRRSPSQLRNMLEVRVRRLAQSYDPEVRRLALNEIRQLVDEAIAQLDADGEVPA
jgi:hypothetical protein